MNKYNPKVGDLIRDKEFPEDFGVIVEIDTSSYTNYCKVISWNGCFQWLPKDYIVGECEVMCASR